MAISDLEYMSILHKVLDTDTYIQYVMKEIRNINWHLQFFAKMSYADILSLWEETIGDKDDLDDVLPVMWEKAEFIGKKVFDSEKEGKN